MIAAAGGFAVEGVRGASEFRAKVLEGECWFKSGAAGGAGCDVEGDDGDVVILAEALRGLGDVVGGFMADLLRTLEAEEFTLRVSGLDDTVGEKYEAIALVELEADLLVDDVGDDSKRQARRQFHLAAIAVGAQVAGVRNRHHAAGIDAGTEASGEAGHGISRCNCAWPSDCTEHYHVEVVENGAGVVRKLIA